LPDITVREIAEKVRRIDEDVAKVVDRIRNWTDEGLLTPKGRKNPGTGKHRVYPASSLADALVLSILTDAVGMQAVKGPIGRMFKALRNTLEFAADGTPRLAKGDGLEKLINDANSGPGSHFLLIGLSRDSRVPPEIVSIPATGLSKSIGESQHESHVVIDLWKLNQRIRSKENPDG
jgi:hypothetical protein